MALLDLGVNATYANWTRHPDSARLRPDTLERAGLVFGVHAALRTLLAERAVADSWVWHANREALFGGRPAIELMTGGSVADLARVRSYLEALVHGGPARTVADGVRPPETVRLLWERSVRLAPARRPLVRLFEDVAEPEDLEAVGAALSIVAPEARPSRDGEPMPGAAGDAAPAADFGAYLAARDRPTAIAEMRARQDRFLRAAELPSTDVVVSAHVAAIDARVRDLRGLRSRPADAPPGAGPLATAPPVRARADRGGPDGPDGIVYDSAETPDGQCVVLFGPHGVRAPVREAGRVIYRWDGNRRAIVETFDEIA